MRLTLLDLGWNQAHHLAFHLTRAGHQVELLSAEPIVNAGLVRYATQTRLDALVTSVAALEAVLRKDTSDFLLPLSEDLLELSWHLEPEFADRVFPKCSNIQREALSDRRRMYAVTAETGVPVPRFRLLGGSEDLPGAIEEFGLPIVIRGTRGFAGEQVRVVDSVDAATKAYDAIRRLSPEPPFAQEYHEGRRCLFGALFHEGKILQYFSQMAVATSTPTGPAIRVQSLRDSRLLEYNTALFARLGWTGLACAEYIRTADGDYRFLEINPRPWASIQASHVCGVPLMTSFAEYLNGDRRERRSDFPDGKVVTLFPQFFLARMRTGRFGRPADYPAYCQGILQAPWFSPGLMLHALRQIWWAR